MVDTITDRQKSSHALNANDSVISINKNKFEYQIDFNRDMVYEWPWLIISIFISMTYAKFFCNFFSRFYLQRSKNVSRKKPLLIGSTRICRK